MPERIQLSRKKGWRMPPNTVSVARPTRWGNPYPLTEFGLTLSLELFNNTARGIWSPSPLAGQPDEVLDSAYAKHTAWLRRLTWHPVEAASSELQGMNLACWCPPDHECHADILLAIANPTALPEGEAS